MGCTRGTTLVTTLMIAAIVTIVVAMLAGLSFFQLSVATRSLNTDKARMMAETTLAIAESQLLANIKAGQKTYGTHQEWVHYQPAGATPDQTGDLNFSQTQTQVPWSLNNLTGLSPGSGSTHRVPAFCIDLVAVGRAGTETRTAEVILYIPHFDKALSASGQVQSSGGLTLGGIPSGYGAISCYNKCNFLPADLQSNSCCPTQAVSLGPYTTISGDVQAVGGIQLNGATVQGQVKSCNQPVPLPSLNIPCLAPTPGPGVLNIAPCSEPSALPVTGFARHCGCLYVAGDVQLCNGVLYVSKNLHIHGGVTGLGA
ncbi:MAG TPA: hypothetical protein VGO93_22110, partial [Candidatus Xenobia bacterium]